MSGPDGVTPLQKQTVKKQFMREIPLRLHWLLGE